MSLHVHTGKAAAVTETHPCMGRCHTWVASTVLCRRVMMPWDSSSSSSPEESAAGGFSAPSSMFCTTLRTFTPQVSMEDDP